MHICLNTSCFVVQWLSCVWIFASSWAVACQASLSLTMSWSLPKFISIVLVMPSYHVILCCPLLLLPSVFPTIGVFSNESAVHIRWPKYWNFSFSISPSKDYSVLISFKIDWFGKKKLKKNKLTGLIFLLSRILSRVFSSTTVWNYQFFNTLPLLPSSHIHMWLLENHSLDYMDLCWQTDVFAF